jgi:hypothetical protein
VAGLDRFPVEHLSRAPTLVGSVLSIGDGATSSRPIEVTRRIIMGSGPPVTKLSCDVALARRNITIPSCKVSLTRPPQCVSVSHGEVAGATRPRDIPARLVDTDGDQTLANPSGRGSVVRRSLAIADCESAIASRISTRRGCPVTLCSRLFTIAGIAEFLRPPRFHCRPVDEVGGPLAGRRSMPSIRLGTVTGRSIQVAGSVVLCLRFAIAQLGSDITLCRREVTLEALDISIAWGRRHGTNVFTSHPACSSAHLQGASWSRDSVAARRRPIAAVTRPTRSRGAKGLTM